MTEGRNVPGEDGAPSVDLIEPTEPAAADPTDATEPPADEAPSEPPTIGWATGVQWEQVDANRRAPMPGRVTLQAGSVFRRTLDTFLRRPLLFLGLAIPGALIGLVGPTGGAQPANPWPAFIFFLLDSAVSVPFSVAMIVATGDLRADRELSLRSVIERALGRTVPALISELVTGVAAAGVVFLPAILGAQSLGAGGGAVVLIVLVVVLVYVGIRLLLSQPAIALDQMGPIQGLTGSWAVTKGNMWKLMGLLIALGLLTLPLSLGAGLLAANTSQTIALGVSAITTLVAAPLTAIALAIAYGDLTGRPAIDPIQARGGRNRRLLIVAILGFGLVACVIGIPRSGSVANARPLAPVSFEVGDTID